MSFYPHMKSYRQYQAEHSGKKTCYPEQDWSKRFRDKVIETEFDKKSIGDLVTISLETTRIVRGLPALDILEPGGLVSHAGERVPTS